MIDMIDSLFGLPAGHEFTPAVRWLLIFGMVSAAVTLFNAIVLVMTAWMMYLIYGVKKETRDLLIVVREWVEVAKGIRESTRMQGNRIEAKTNLVAGAVEAVPEKVVKRITEMGDSHGGT